MMLLQIQSSTAGPSAAAVRGYGELTIEGEDAECEQKIEQEPEEFACTAQKMI